MTRSLASAIVSLALLGLCPAAAEAGGVQVTPVIIELRPQPGVGALRVRNFQDRNTAFEIDVFDWSQADGLDVLTPTRDLIIAPTVFAVAPGREQIIRLALAPNARGAAVERTFRLILRELPEPERPQRGPRLVLEMSLPVFFTPESASPKLSAQPSASETAPAVTLTNEGAAHVRLIGARYGADAQMEDLPRYLLAGAAVARPLSRRIDELHVAYVAPGSNMPSEQVLIVGDPPSPPVQP